MFNNANQLSNVGKASEFLSLLGLKCKYRNTPCYLSIIRLFLAPALIPVKPGILYTI